MSDQPKSTPEQRAKWREAATLKKLVEKQEFLLVLIAKATLLKQRRQNKQCLQSLNNAK